MPEILNLLDETKKIFRSSVYREMVLLLDGMEWWIVVDEIAGVQDFEVIKAGMQGCAFGRNSYILNVLEGEGHGGLIFEVNVNAVLERVCGEENYGTAPPFSE